MRPQVSVIIPTRDRPELLARTLRGLACQTYPVDQFEVLVVDDGGQRQLVRGPTGDYPFRFRYIWQEHQGEVAARNAGAQRAQGQLLVFLDDDIEVSPVYLQALAEVHASRPDSLVLGRLIEVPGGGFRVRTATEGQRRPGCGLEQQAEPASFLECMSGILSIPRVVFFEIGGMQPLRDGERHNIWGGIDLGFRAHRHGCTFYRPLNAIAIHHDRNLVSFRAQCHRHYRVASEVHALFAKYPDLRFCIPMFYDKQPVQWREDPLPLVIRKIGRRVMSCRPVLYLMDHVEKVLATSAPESRLLAVVRRWILGACLYRGYRGWSCHLSEPGVE